MKRFTTSLAILATLVLTSSASGTGHQYGWSISSSSTNPMANTGAAGGGVGTLYLWFECSTDDGASAAEFDISANGMTHLSTTATNGFLNAGGTSNVLLAVGGCPTGPVVACSMLILDNAGEMCIVPSAANGVDGTVDCQPLPSVHSNTTNGYSSSGGSPSCFAGNPLCPPDPVISNSWGEIKGLYR